MDVSRNKMCLDTSILATVNMNRSEYRTNTLSTKLTSALHSNHFDLQNTEGNQDNDVHGSCDPHKSSGIESTPAEAEALSKGLQVYLANLLICGTF
jgi:hypothetical protein